VDLALPGDLTEYATAELSVSGMRIAASYVHSFTERLRIFAGAGAAMYSFQYDSSREDWAASFGTSPDMVNISVQAEGHDSKLLSPFLHCGVEWMLMERWGVSLAGSISVPAEYLVQHRIEVKDSSGVMVDSFVHDYVVWKTPAAFVGGNVSFYF